MGVAADKHAHIEIGYVETTPRSVGFRLAISFVVCLLTFLTLSILSYCIPNTAMEAHLQESAVQLGGEGLYHIGIEGNVTQSIDNFTVGIMLNEASHGATNPIKSAMLNPLTGDGPDPIARFANGIGVPDELITAYYAQYWHGYLILLKPLLLLLNLNEIREFSLLLFTCLLGLVSILVSKRSSVASGIAVIGSFAAFNIYVMVNSLSLSACPYLALFASLFVLWKTNKGEKLLPKNSLWWIVPFFILGALTSFFDFLCTPITTLGIPLTLLLLLSRGSVNRKNILRCLLGMLLICAAWAIGYIGLWVSKWIVAMAITGEDVIAMGMGKVSERVSDHASDAVGSESISRVVAVGTNVRLAFPNWSIIIYATIVVLIIAVIAYLHTRSRTSRNLWWTLPLGTTALLPYVWYILAANHSYQHSWFTYRSQLTTVLCLTLVFAGLLHDVQSVKAESKNGMHAKRKELSQ